jgi:hypothetical protein
VTPTPARLLMSESNLEAYASLSSPIIVRKKSDSLFWKLGEPLFNTVRDAFTKSAEMAQEDLERREREANQPGPLAQMDRKISEIANPNRKKYKTQTESDLNLSIY